MGSMMPSENIIVLFFLFLRSEVKNMFFDASHEMIAVQVRHLLHHMCKAGGVHYRPGC
jgi:hypothetical protein